MTTRHEFAHSLIGLGGFKPNVQNYTLFLCWFEAEGTLAKNNPLACVDKAPGSTDFNKVPVQNYISEAQGLKMTLRELSNGKYPDIFNRLMDGEDAIFTMAAIQSSQWGTKFDQPTSFLNNVRANWSKYAFKTIPQ